MNALQLIVLGGMLVLTGLGLLVRVFHPAPPKLGVVLAQLNAAPTRAQAHGTAASDGPSWIPEALIAFAERHLGAKDEDLAILGRTRGELAVAKLGWAAGGALLPPVFAAIMALAGVHLPFPIPAVASVILALLA